jgi:fatty-acid desaturase
MSARHAMAWYEFDGDYYLIWILRKLGLVRKVRVARLKRKSTGSEMNEAVIETA